MFDLGNDIGLTSTERSLVADCKILQEYLPSAHGHARFLAVGSDLQVIADMQGFFHWVSPSVESTLGWTVAEMISRPWLEFVHPDDVAKTASETENSLSGQKTFAFENRYRCKDGSYRWFMWKAQPYPDEQLIYGAAVDITERKETEVALQQITTALSNAVEGIAQLDVQGHYLMVNQSYAGLVGYTPEEMIGMDWRLTVHPDDLDKLGHAYQEMLKNGKVEAEARGIRKDGTVFYKRITMVTNYTPQREFVGHYCFMKDISARIQLEQDREAAIENLRQQEAFLKSIYDGAELAIFVVDLSEQGEFRYASFNPVSERYAGVTNVQIQGKTPEDVFGQSFGAKLRQNYQRCLQAGTSITYEELLEFDVHSLWTLTTLVPLRDEAGKIYRLVGTATDITDRKQMEEALRQSEQRLQAMLDNSTAVIYMKDIQGRYLMINRSYETLFHIGRQEIVGKTDFDIFPPDIAEAFQANDAAAILAGTALESEEVAPQDGKPHTYLTIKCPLIDSRGSVYAVCGMSTDISDRKRGEVELKRQQLELSRSNAELQQFAYVASHDLQEPLRMITSYLELLERRYKGQLDAKADQFIGFAVDGATRMQTLISDLLLYSRAGAHTKALEWVDVEVVLQKALDNLQIVISERCPLITHTPLPQVTADPTQLIQVFQNLISNAIKFCREETPRIHIACEVKGDRWLFSVQDNGIGIQPEFEERVFLIFQRLHSRSEYPGTGIGLALCKKIVESHGGKLWVKSGSESGSTFFFTLPQVC